MCQRDHFNVYNGIIALFCGLVLKGVQLRLK